MTLQLSVMDSTGWGAGARWLVDDDLTPGALGMLATVALTGGAAQLTAVPGMESAAVVLSGTVLWEDADQRRLLHPGDGAFSPVGDLQALRTASSGTRLLLLYSRRDPVRGAAITAGACWRYAAAGALADATLCAAGGFADMGVRWLATSDTVGSSRLVVATSTFSPAGHHALHRHPHADEFFLVMDGGGDHLSPHGPIRLGPGDLVFIPAGEWHGYRTGPGTATRAIYGYLGAGSLEQAGYELDQSWG